MALVTRRAAPTLEDARRAAQALVDVGVGEVWLYGSVARGESEPGSDIDLVAVLDDLEYRQRLRVKSELQEVARSACGRRVEVLVTDRVEWRIQREQVSASLLHRCPSGRAWWSGSARPCSTGASLRRSRKPRARP